MLYRGATWLALLLAASSTNAQTSTSCDPTKKTCPEDTALSSRTYTHDFTSSGFDSDAWNITAGNVTATSSGLEFTVTKSGDAPTIRSKWYIFFGRVSFFLRAAPGTGIVSSAILQSDDLDEIDLEWLGGTGYVDKVQSNYFSMGKTISYDRAAWATVSDSQSTTHNYTISWTKSATVWYVDEVAVRTLNYADALGGKNYPQTPMDVRIGIWSGGDPANDEGTIEWAGGETDYNAGPFTMYLEKIEVVNENPGSSYEYGDMTGEYTSIKVNDAEESDESDVSSSASASSASSSATASGTSRATTETASVSASQTGLWGNASASASAERAQAVSNGAPSMLLTNWQKGVLGALLLLISSW